MPAHEFVKMMIDYSEEPAPAVLLGYRLDSQISVQETGSEFILSSAFAKIWLADEQDKAMQSVLEQVEAPTEEEWVV